MTESNMQNVTSQPPQAAAGAGAAGSAASRPGASAGHFRLPAHGPAYQAMHAMLQRRRQELQKEGAAADGAAAPNSSTAVYPLGPPSVSLPPQFGVVVAVGSTNQGVTAAPDPLQPMLSF